MLFRVKSSKCISKCEQAHGRWEKKRDAKECGKFAFFPMTQQHQCGTSFFSALLSSLSPRASAAAAYETRVKQKRAAAASFERKKLCETTPSVARKANNRFRQELFLRFYHQSIALLVSFFTFQWKLFWSSAQGKKVDGPSIFHRSIFACPVTDFSTKNF